ncbi:MAG: YncE family protein [Polyangiaceae bacterium]
MKPRVGCALAVLVACNAAPPASPSTTIASAAAPPPAPDAQAPAPPLAAGDAAASPAPPEIVARSLELPGAKGPVSIDLIAYDHEHGRVWVPVGDTGSVDVFEIGSGTFTRVDGFKTESREKDGHTRIMGPSAAAIGDGVAYVGDRATSEVCAVDQKSLKRGACLKLSTPADFMTYVAATKEVWVTTPKDQSLTLLDASKPAALTAKLTIKAPGSVEGAAIDAEHGVFYTNLEDKNRTLAVDIKSHAIKATWSPGCSDAPHGVAVDPARGLVIVACSDDVRILDASHDGAVLAKLDTGDGVDDISYDGSKQLLYVAASKARRLTIARIGEGGRPTAIATGATAERARNAVADVDGNVYVADAANARFLIFAAPR